MGDLHHLLLVTEIAQQQTLFNKCVNQWLAITWKISHPRHPPDSLIVLTVHGDKVRDEGSM